MGRSTGRSTRQLKVPAAVARYYGRSADAVVVAEFPQRRLGGGLGWVRCTYRKRISVSWARKLLRSGVTHVAIVPVDDLDRAPADFSLIEIVRGGAAD